MSLKNWYRFLFSRQAVPDSEDIVTMIFQAVSMETHKWKYTLIFLGKQGIYIFINYLSHPLPALVHNNVPFITMLFLNLSH